MTGRFKRKAKCAAPPFRLGLTLAFEILIGRFVVGVSWERLAADYNVLEGGLLPFGMAVLLLSPLLATKIGELTQ